MAIITGNFDFLQEHDPVFFQLASTAEQVFASDPNTTLIKLRQLGEALAQNIAARCGIEIEETTPQADLLYKLNREIRLDRTIRDLFHTLRFEGNKATHQFRTQHKEAMDGLRLARALAVWFHQSSVGVNILFA
jgi:type I restriction enzyme R subunit